MMKDKVILAIEKFIMINKGDNITVALSGGADSVALLFVLKELELDINLSAAHLNHCLRGEEADRDEAFVRALCEELGVPLTVERADIKGISKKTGESIELCARRVRYEFLERVSPGKIATAHTASDSLETVLLNIARGTGLKGLTGIPPVRGKIIRPLIYCSRQDIEEYCRLNNLNYVTDSSNLTDQYTRNKIRLHIVPKLAEINPALVRTFSRMTDILRSEDEYLDQAVQKHIAQSINGIDVNILSLEHPAIIRRVIATYYKNRVKESPDQFHICEIEKLILNKSGKTGLKSNFFAEVRDGRLVILKETAKPQGFCIDVDINNLPVTLPEGRIDMTVISVDEFKKKKNINNLFYKNSLDYDKIKGKIQIRSRKSGDTFRQAGRGVTKSLKKLFNEAKIPKERRMLIPLLSDEQGIIWIEGFGIAERVKIDQDTKQVLLVHFEG